MRARLSPAVQTLLRQLASGDRLVYRTSRGRTGWWLEEGRNAVRLATIDHLRGHGWIAPDDAGGETPAAYVISEAGRAVLPRPRTPRPDALPEPEDPAVPTEGEAPLEESDPPLRPRFGEARTVEEMFRETWHTMTDHEKEIARQFFEEGHWK